MPFRPKQIALAAGVMLAVLIAFVVWRSRGPQLPEPGSETYENAATAFYAGLAALQVGLLENALEDFTRATTLVPPEPASWANLGVARLRLGDVDAAAEPIEQAMALAPDNGDIALLAAQMQIARGGLDEAVGLLRRAIELDPQHLRARFALAEELERAGTSEGDAEAAELLDELLAIAPGNLAVLLERARVAAKRSDRERLDDSTARLAAPAAGWPEIAVEQYRGLQEAAASGNFTSAARQTALLRNVLARVPAYGSDVAAVRTPADVIAEPFEQFLVLEPPPSTPAPPDPTVTFAAQQLDGRQAHAVVALSLTGEGQPAVFAADASRIWRLGATAGEWPFPGGGTPPGRSGLLAIDWNNDFRTDLVAAGAGGLRLLLQTESGAFEDATAAASGGTPVSCGCSGAWAADVEMDGDLDVIAGVAGGPAIVLRNNGDGTWTAADTFAAVSDVQDAVWADLDRDADPDAAFLDGRGAVRVMRNRQAGQFVEAAAPDGWSGVTGLMVADVDADGAFDLIAAADGALRRASMSRAGEWDESEVPGVSDVPPGLVRLLAADLDNNGALDLIASGDSTRAWIADEQHEMAPLAAAIEAGVTSAVDLDTDGRVDLLGAGGRAGPPVQLLGRGSGSYHWKRVRVRAQPVAGDQRINSFAVGGEIEVRAGLLRQKQLLTGMPLHFGLGTRPGIDVVRIVWPNGNPQAEFGIGVDDEILAEQRLKGSCPWVFAYDGEEMQFVTDFLWRSPLGLRINAQDTAGVSQTEDWVRIRGDQLAARSGMYDIRITAELWETHFFDHVSLMVVDHPDGTDVFVDERFSNEPVAFTVRALRDRRAVVNAVDQDGHDVTPTVAARDGRYLSTFARGRYQGIAQEHFVEFSLPDAPLGTSSAGSSGLVLVAHGWVYPTDSSINVAVAQGRHDAPRTLSLEAQDEHGKWRVVDADLGFPAGKNKTMLIDLRGAADAARLRLRTNLEVYWDSLEVGVPAGVTLRTVRTAAAGAELRYRGFSRTTSPRGDAPETPAYAPLAARGQRWRDLTGYHTRFGDVRELLTGVDDRYVIMNAGDELALTFAAPPAPDAGWRRDFFLIGDGWEKDGDYNTEFSQTVLPLPSHGPAPYDPASPPVELEDDPVYQRHRADWERYHTRYVTPERFVNGLAVR